MPTSVQYRGHPLSSWQRRAMLIAAFLGWFFGGVQIGITNVAMRDAPMDLMARQGELDLATLNHLQQADPATLGASQRSRLDQWNAAAARWFAWYQCAFLFGAACGGYVFGRLGDRIGRTRSLAISILFFSLLSGASYFVQTPMQLLVLRFLACVGIGGTWPNGVSLVSEAWSGTARAVVASSIGMAGNLGIFAMFSLSAWRAVTPEDWRWVMIVGALPIVLGIWIWWRVPESPTWLHLQRRREHPGSDGAKSNKFAATTRSSDRPVLQNDSRSASRERHYGPMVILGIALATVPLIGGWGSANWMIPWAGEAGAAVGNDFLKANVGQARSITSIVGSMAAGWIACLMGRRTTYAITSLGALLVAQYAFWFSTPTAPDFLVWVAILGFFNGVYFGWLPFFLPELFEARMRSTGTGLSFNSGRILTAVTIFATGTMKDLFHGDYAMIGRVTSWIFLLGVIAIAFAPDTSKEKADL